MRARLFALLLAFSGWASAGVVDWSYGPHTASSSSCVDVLAAMQTSWSTANFVFDHCSADPVVVGTSIYIWEVDSQDFGTYEVTGMTGFDAAPPPAPPASAPASAASSPAATSADTERLIVAVLAGFVVLAFGVGFMGGNAS